MYVAHIIIVSEQVYYNHSIQWYTDFTHCMHMCESIWPDYLAYIIIFSIDIRSSLYRNLYYINMTAPSSHWQSRLSIHWDKYTTTTTFNGILASHMACIQKNLTLCVSQYDPIIWPTSSIYMYLISSIDISSFLYQNLHYINMTPPSSQWQSRLSILMLGVIWKSFQQW